jgi:hypothetical protein
MSDASLIVPGLVHVGGREGQAAGALVQVGAAAGWTMPKGIHSWRRELSVALKADLNPALCASLGVVLPESQGDDQSVPRARKAAQACSLVAVEGELADKLIAKGTRVHTVGFDSVSNGFYYMARGGSAPARRIQGGLIEMITPSLTEGSNQEIESHLDGLIDRFVSELTDGMLTEAQLELADALPALGPKDRAGAAKLQELEGWLILVSTRSQKHESEARKLVETLRSATMRGTETTPIPLLGEAHRVAQSEITVEFVDGDAGQHGRLTLPARSRWFVTGTPTASMLPTPGMLGTTPAPPATKETPRQPAVRPVVPQAPPGVQPAARQASVDAAAAEKAAADRAAAQRAAERSAAEQAAAQRAAAERAAAEKAAAERAAAERAAAERAAAERAAGERAAAERAAERAATERAAAERAAAEKAAADKAAAEKAAADKATAEKAAADKAESEKAAQKAASEKAAIEKSAAARITEKPKAAAAEPTRSAKPAEKEGGFPIDVVVLVLVLIAVIVVVVRRYVLHH